MQNEELSQNTIVQNDESDDAASGMVNRVVIDSKNESEVNLPRLERRKFLGRAGGLLAAVTLGLISTRGQDGIFRPTRTLPSKTTRTRWS